MFSEVIKKLQAFFAPAHPTVNAVADGSDNHSPTVVDRVETPPKSDAIDKDQPITPAATDDVTLSEPPKEAAVMAPEIEDINRSDTQSS